MKPHIRRRHGIWYCGFPFRYWPTNTLVILPLWGEGYTPSAALAAWKEMQ